MSTAYPPTIARTPQNYDSPPSSLGHGSDDQDWMRYAVGGTMLTGAILLLTGKRRAGLVVTAAATALTLLDQQDTLRAWWESLPRYLDDAQLLLNQAQHTVDDLVEKRDKLRAMFNR